MLVLSAGSFHRAVHTFFELLEHFLLRLIRFVSLLFSPLITLLPAISQKEMMAVFAMIAHWMIAHWMIDKLLMKVN